MKHGLLIILLSLCVMSVIANGRKFVCENDTVQIENSEAADSDESSVTSFHSLFYHAVRYNPASLFYTLDLLEYRYLASPTDAIHLDFFTPPPEL